ncbi:hypothetical protein SH1V18_43870 [Vallitalea longa]|uniref:Uncharacterized protein n=1 Tax=Vallitalea longa TaxID=2936439 RepID=A0A9W6DHT5_9FIRM|nr:hypothetical protein [Vallitalea longa]GKX31907.1 hypothetical protein SH1V18_43870 [Vallitalea longa]
MNNKNINKDIKVKISFSDNKKKECIENTEDVLAKMYAQAIINNLKENVTEDKRIETIVKIEKLLEFNKSKNS